MSKYRPSEQPPWFLFLARALFRLVVGYGINARAGFDSVGLTLNGPCGNSGAQLLGGVGITTAKAVGNLLGRVPIGGHLFGPVGLSFRK